MSANSPTLYTVEYANTLQMLAQQVQSKLMACVTVGGGHTGEQASPVDQYGSIEVSENAGRFEAMPRTDLAFDRRWVFPTNWDVNQLADKNDLVRMMTDPKQGMARASVAAMNRRRDRTILDGMINANFTGKTGTTSTTLGSGQIVSVDVGGAASGLNVAKLREALRILMANDVDIDGEEFYCALSAQAHVDLLAEVQVTSADYNPRRDGEPVLENGRIAKFLGFNFVHCERATEFNGTDDQAGTSTPIMAWAKSGVYFGGWREMVVDVKERADLRAIPWQIYTCATFGATRLEEDKVVKIWARP
jgi:hypothetical protein